MDAEMQMLEEIDRCHQHIERTRVLMRALWHAWESEDRLFFSSMNDSGGGEVCGALQDAVHALLWLRKEIMDFSLAPQGNADTKSL